MPIVFYSPEDPASMNIANFLKGAPLRELPSRGAFAENISVETDYIIFASRHAGEGGPCLTCHAPGVWGSEAKLGGKPHSLAPAPAHKLKQAAQALSRAAQEINWPFSLEATHHGPFIQAPCLFMEVGSSEKEWGDEKAGHAVAKAIKEVLASPDSTSAIPAFGVGGTHYCPKFGRLQLEEKYAVGHILPKYFVDEISLEMFRQGIEKTTPRAEKVLLDWKGLTAPQRQKIAGFCKEIGIDAERV